MEAQRTRARAASQFSLDYTNTIRLDGATEFRGYEVTELSAEIIGLYSAGQAVDNVSEGADVALILAQTAFYAESGGQVGDRGIITKGSAVIEVSDCRKVGNHHVHTGQVVSGQFSFGEQVEGTVDKTQRHAVTLNHSATHLLHEALRQVLGEHVHQKGSLVDHERLRFDFSHGEAVTTEQIRRIEYIVNAEVLKNTQVMTDVMSMEEAKAKGAMALFGEKYGEQVRVVSIGGEFSVELCGGTHVSRTGDIGLLRVSGETSVAAGIRRIESVTGMGALALCDKEQDSITDIATMVRGARNGLGKKVQSIIDENKRLQKDLEKLKNKLANVAGSDLMSSLRTVNNISVLATVVDGADSKSLRGIADQVRSKIQSGVFLLAAIEGQKAALIAGVTSDLTDRIKAGDLLKFVTAQVGGKGGGRADMAQGAAGDITNLASALESVYDWVEKR